MAQQLHPGAPLEAGYAVGRQVPYPQAWDMWPGPPRGGVMRSLQSVEVKQ